MPFARRPVLRYVGRGWYESLHPVEYVGATDAITIPAGTRTDLASVPRIFWWLLPPTGVYEDAAFVHDVGCNQLRDGTCALTSRDVDGLFRRIVREDQEAEPRRHRGVDVATRWWLWSGVRLGALANPHRRSQWWRDGWLALLILAATLAVAGGVVYALDRLAHWIV